MPEYKTQQFSCSMRHTIREIRDTIAVILNIEDKRASLLVRDDFTIILLELRPLMQTSVRSQS